MTYILDVKHLGVIWKVFMVKVCVIHGTAKCKADPVVKNGKFVIQKSFRF